MPNWTSNQLVIEGSKKLVDKCLKAIRSEDEYIDFDKILPMPKCLRSIHSGCATIKRKDGVEVSVRTWKENKKGVPRFLTPREKKEVAATGAESWYDWSNANWGCKWNARRSELRERYDFMAELWFETPWSAPVGILNALRKKFPDLEFTLRFRHEDDPEFPHDADNC